MKLIFARIYQKILYVATNLMKFRTPTILYNILDIKEVLKNKNFKNVLLLSGKRVCKEEFYIRLDESLKDEFTEEEMVIFNRGRNGTATGHRKNINRKEHVISSGYEAVIGYLYLKGDFDRLNYIMQKSIEIVENKQ